MTTTIIANTDFTAEFHRICFWRSPGVILKPSNMFTQRLSVLADDVRLSAIVQITKVSKHLVFLN